MPAPVKILTFSAPRSAGEIEMPTFDIPCTAEDLCPVRHGTPGGERG